MKKILVLIAALFIGAPAYGQQVNIYCNTGGGGLAAWQPCGSANPLAVTGTFTPAATSPNFTPVAPATATATKGTLLGIQYDSTQKTLTDGQQAAASASVRGALFVASGADALTVQPGNTANTTPWLVTNSPASAAAAATTSASSTAAASNLVLKGSAGNLYSLTITIGATSGYAMLFDATSLPGNGAVTPVWCYPVTSNGTNGGVAIEFATPKRFGTGITAGFSTTGCFTMTASATGNFFGGYQ